MSTLFPNFFFSATKINHLGTASCIGHFETEKEANAVCDFNKDYRHDTEFFYSYRHFIKCYFCGFKITAIQTEMEFTNED